MESLTRQQASDWCQAHGIALDERGRPDRPGAAAVFDIPVDSGARVALVAGQAQAFQNSRETLLWFTDWSVWPSSERPHIFTRFRASYGETRRLGDIPAHLFAAAEYEDAVSFVTLGALFLWDVFLVGSEGRPMLFYSHDEWGWLVE